jgi:Tol biopolymer transport system component
VAWRTPLTFDPANERSPRWSPGGDQIVFTRAGAKPGLYLTAASGTGDEELLLAVERPPAALPASWYGRTLLYISTSPVVRKNARSALSRRNQGDPGMIRMPISVS